MKTLVLTAHPDLDNSRINRLWFDALSETGEITTRDLTATGGETMRFDVEAEQALLLAHDRIVFQFPFYWYSAPPVLKAWMDQVLSFGFAYGPGGDRLAGREFLILVSTGGPADSYHAGGYNSFSMDELLKPYQQMAILTGMTYLRPFVQHGLAVAEDAGLAESVRSMLAHVTDPELDPKVKHSRILREIEEQEKQVASVA
ncbi:NAD(P)H-dependent oxidoreductase [Tropicimonas marinistellae]|uniref:NAD(P)H-dependent oxidoreductase n=1 Tax=Tropicimonas marinistellae TaxID=1739787 RepID=UPI0008346309|nr:NAD(P)H-dependent oxidoreductase [Tropicimonas marinistellae]